MATWPVSLPDAFLVDGYQEQSPDNVISFETDTGPAKIRKRSTANPRQISGSIFPLTKTQVTTLDTFYQDNAAIPFTFDGDRIGTLADFRFTAPPTYRSICGDVWSADIQVERMP